METKTWIEKKKKGVKARLLIALCTLLMDHSSDVEPKDRTFGSSQKKGRSK